MKHDMTRFNEDDTLWRFIETALALIRYAKAKDGEGIAISMRQLVNISSGWILSSELGKAEHIRQEALMWEQEAKKKREEEELLE